MYCLRFVFNCRMKDKLMRDKRAISMNEYQNAIQRLIKLGRSVSKKSKLTSLDPFLDPTDGVLRVNGRIQAAHVPYDTRFPIILASNHPLTKLIVLNHHYEDLHAGVQTLVASLRQSYWPIGGRRFLRADYLLLYASILLVFLILRMESCEIVLSLKGICVYSCVFALPQFISKL